MSFPESFHRVDGGMHPGDPNSPPTADDPSLTFRPPVAADGARMWEIARDSRVLDLNSPYAYVLWAQEFAETSVVVETGERVVGFVTGFVRPDEVDGRGSLFVWQVGVDADQRGRGLAVRMLHSLMDRASEQGIERLRTTISPDNEASRRTFAALARDRDQTLAREDYLSAELLAVGDGGAHEPEDLYTVA